MIAAAYGISLCVGILTYTLIGPKNTLLNRITRIMIALAIGIGVNVALTFFTLLASGHFSRFGTLLTHLMACGMLGIIICMRHKQKLRQWGALPKLDLHSIVCMASWAGCAGVFYLISTRHPFGEWDAWAIWNLKTRFIIAGGEKWTFIFHKLHWHTHPDYPLFLPMINTWIHALGNQGLYPTAMWTSIFFSLATGIALYSLLRLYVPASRALIASLILLAHPYYAFLSTSQYADVVLSFYLILAIGLCAWILDHPEGNLCVIAGLLTGFMTFIKNEGIAMAGLLTALFILFIYTDQKLTAGQKKHLVARFMIGGLTGSLPAIILKTFLASGNDDQILPAAGLQATSTLINHRFNILLNGIYAEFVEVRQWCFIWIFITVTALLGIKRWQYRRHLFIFLFLLLYFGCVMGIYLFTQPQVDLAWWLEHSLARVLLTMLPVWLMLIFMLHAVAPQQTNPEAA